MGKEYRGNVLVVDDDHCLLHLFDKVLTLSKFKTRTAANIDAAKDLFQQHHFDLLICDLSVAGGKRVFDFVSAARNQNPRVGVLIVTGLPPQDIASQAKSLGIELLEKPFSPAELLSRVSLVLSRKAA